MNVVQTFCSFGNDPLTHKLGWYASRYHLSSWALSAHTIAQHHPNLALYTDTTGYELLVGKLQLPYKNVFLTHDNLCYLPSALFSVAKIKTFALQTKAFLHIDGDVYLNKKLSERLLSSPLIAQNLERATHKYVENLNCTKRKLHYAPALLRRHIFAGEVTSCNTGIIGGHKLDYFKQLYHLAMRTITRNPISTLHRQLLLNLNVLLEQVLLYRLANVNEQAINCLFSEVIPDFGYTAQQFADVSQPYVHLIGGHKRSRVTCMQVETALRRQFPKAHARVSRLFK